MREYSSLTKQSLRTLRPSAAFAEAALIEDSFRACPLIASSTQDSRHGDSPTPLKPTPISAQLPLGVLIATAQPT